MIERLRWNDVSKLLPDEGVTVLIWVRDTRQDVSPWWTTGLLDRGAWQDVGNYNAQMTETEFVTHWADPEGPGA